MKFTTPSRIVPLAVAMLLSSFALAQNEDCANAIYLPVVPPGSCAGVTGNNYLAAWEGVQPVCDAGFDWHDVWYFFQAGPGNSVSITLTPEIIDDYGFAVYTGCGGSSISCQILPSGPISVSTTQGSFYWIQVFTNGNNGNGGSFQICVEGQVTPPPANDTPFDPTALTVEHTCVPVTGTVAGATDDGVASTCSNAGHADEDVWYIFQSTEWNIFIDVDGASQFNAVVEVYQLIFGDLFPIACANTSGDGGTENLWIQPTALGNTYYVRVYDHGVGTPGTPTFTICAYDPCPNDLCSDAIALTMQPTCNYTAGDAFLATGDQPTAGCNGGSINDMDDVVWYQFVATSTEGHVSVDGNGSASTGYDPVVQLIYANNCSGPFTQLDCADATGAGGTEQIDLSGLIPGTTYFIVVYDKGQGAPGTTTFNICVQEMSTAGTADLATAADLTIRRDQDLAIVQGRTSLGEVRLLDLSGRCVQAIRTSNAQAVLDLSSRPAGVYLVQVTSNDGVRTVRFVKE